MTVLFACRRCATPSEDGLCPSCKARAQQQHNAKRTRGTKGQRIRAQVLTRDEHRCTWIEDGGRCAETENLEVHHVNGDRNDDRLANLRTFCMYHHHRLELRNR